MSNSDFKLCSACKGLTTLFERHECSPLWRAWYYDGDGSYDLDEAETFHASSVSDASEIFCGKHYNIPDEWSADVVVQSVATGDFFRVQVEAYKGWHVDEVCPISKRTLED